MTVHEAAEKIGAKIICKGENKEISGVYIGDLLSVAMSHVGEGNIWITVQTNINTAAVAALTDAACILMPEGLSPDEDTAKRANAEGINIISVELDAYGVAVKLSEII